MELSDTAKRIAKRGRKKRKIPNNGKVEKVMHEFKEGSLHSGSKKGPLVKNRKQAIAIGISEAKKKSMGGYS